MSESDDNNKDRRDKRRSIVKGITITGTGVTLSHWSKPVVESVILPTHAQTSILVTPFTASAEFSVV